MPNANNRSKARYIIECITFSCAFIFTYRSVCFRNVFETYYFSIIFLCCLYAAFIAISFILTLRRYRNFISVFVTVTTPAGIYTVLTYHRTYPIIVYSCVILAIVLAVIYSIYLISINMPKAFMRGYRKSFFRFLFLNASTVSSFCISFVAILAMVPPILGFSLIRPTEKPEGASIGHNYRIGEHYDTLKYLEQDLWDTLNEKEKLAVLQVVANVERSYLGLPHELVVQAGTMDSETWGLYEKNSHRITISIECLTHESAAICLDTITHEAYHAYQNYLVDEVYYEVDEEAQNLLFFRRVGSYADDINNYVSETSLEYYLQTLEIDAYAYAEDAVEEYYYWLEEFSTKECRPQN